MREEGTLPWIGASKAALSPAVEGYVLAQGELVGKVKQEYVPLRRTSTPGSEMSPVADLPTFRV